MLTIKDINFFVKPVAEKYKVEKIYLFGSYARGDANENSVFGGKNFKQTKIFSLAEDLREIFNKNVDVFEINEINPASNFYQKIMQEKVLVAWSIPTNSG